MVGFAQGDTRGAFDVLELAPEMQHIILLLTEDWSTFIPINSEVGIIFMIAKTDDKTIKLRMMLVILNILLTDMYLDYSVDLLQPGKLQYRLLITSIISHHSCCERETIHVIVNLVITPPYTFYRDVA